MNERDDPVVQIVRTPSIFNITITTHHYGACTSVVLTVALVLEYLLLVYPCIVNVYHQRYVIQLDYGTATSTKYEFFRSDDQWLFLLFSEMKK
jgi:hypothetical protein